MLESRSRTDVREVTIEAPPTAPHAGERFRHLLTSSFYEAGSWQVDRADRTDETETQLLGVVAQSCFDPRGAATRLQMLQKSRLYDRPNNRWLQPDIDRGNYEPLYAYPRLFAVITAALEEPEKAKGMLAEMDFDTTAAGNARSAVAWAFAESYLDRTAARKALERARYSPATPYTHVTYDATTGLFRSNAGILLHTNMHLLHVAATARIEGAEAARRFYEQLKNTPAYEAGTDTWRMNCKETHVRAIEQLLAVIAEAEVERGEARGKQDAVAEIPEILTLH